MLCATSSSATRCGAPSRATSAAHDPIGHLEVVENADAFIIAPATANTIAKLAAGIADSMLTTSFLACTAPRIVAPAMNDRMYRDARPRTTSRPCACAGSRDRPREGPLASRGEHGVGRLPAPERLLASRGAARGSGPWDGLRVLVTAGGTREPIDSVRFIGNRSSGRMGIAVARAAARRGAEVTLVAANVALAEPAGVRRIEVETAAELGAATRARSARRDVLLMAAAVADFRAAERPPARSPARAASGLELRLEETEDVLAAVAPGAGRVRRWSASPPSTGRRRSTAPARSSSARASTRSSSTTSRARRSASTPRKTR